MEKIGLAMFVLAVLTALISFGAIAFLTVKDYYEERKKLK
jgi:hypothetical protein